MTTGELKFQTPWRNLQGYEYQITSYDWKNYSFHVGTPHNIVVSGFTSSVAANIAMRERIMILKALSKKPEPVEPVEDVATVATTTPIEPKRKRGRPPKPEAYTFTAEEDAALVKVPAGAAEDW